MPATREFHWLGPTRCCLPDQPGLFEKYRAMGPTSAPLKPNSEQYNAQLREQGSGARALGPPAPLAPGDLPLRFRRSYVSH
jgi:hypothetical protein